MNKFREVVWTDEKSFVLQLHQYRRNDCILVPIVAHDPNLRLVKRRKQPCSVMVFGAVGSDGSVMDPIIIPNTTTINSASYQNLVLPKLLDWMRATYGPMTGFRGKLGTGRAVLMQDGAPPHTSNSTQKYLEDHIGKDNFWKKTQWPPSSPDVNPMDFSLLASLAAATTRSRLAAGLHGVCSAQEPHGAGQEAGGDLARDTDARLPEEMLLLSMGQAAAHRSSRGRLQRED